MLFNKASCRSKNCETRSSIMLAATSRNHFSKAGRVVSAMSRRKYQRVNWLKYACDENCGAWVICIILISNVDRSLGNISRPCTEVLVNGDKPTSVSCCHASSRGYSLRCVVNDFCWPWLVRIYIQHSTV